MSGTYGRKYGGDPDYAHVPDGQRNMVGLSVADYVSLVIRSMDVDATPLTPVCPGCYMVVLFNAALELARRNGQDIDELARSMSHVFQTMREPTEEIEVL